jgi:hypothetical protein
MEQEGNASTKSLFGDSAGIVHQALRIDYIVLWAVTFTTATHTKSDFTFLFFHTELDLSFKTCSQSSWFQNIANSVRFLSLIIIRIR